MQGKSFYLLLVPLAASATLLTLRAQQIHPGLKSKEKAIHKVLVLPPNVEMVKSGIKGQESMIKESEWIASEIAHLVSGALARKGLSVLESPFTPRALKENQDLNYALADVQNLYDALALKIAKKSKDVAQGRFSMGDHVANVNPGGSADTLVFIRGTASMPTKGMAFLQGGLIGMLGRQTQLSLQIALVDSQTGDVLFFTRIRTAENFLQSQITRHLKKLPT